MHVDGKAVRACQTTLTAAEGSSVVTIEALSRERDHPVQQAFAAEGAVMCGFCTPGMVMAAAALIATTPSPGDADIAGALNNLCRCGVQPRLLRAVRRAAAVARGEQRIAALPPPRIDPADAARAVPAMAVPK